VARSPRRAILLAAGCGRRLGTSPAKHPKCLLEFDGETLLERHLATLVAGGVGEIEMVVGYRHDEVLRALAQSRHRERVRIQINERYEEGSILSLAKVRHALVAGDDVLLMDADVLYDPELLVPLLITSSSGLLLDRNCSLDDTEAVKVCLHGGQIVEFSKQLPPRLAFDCMGESVGFFRLGTETARRLAFHLDLCLALEADQEPYEVPLRRTILESAKSFAAYDVTHLDWIEIDFPSDLRRARDFVWPRLSSREAHSL